MYCVESAVLYSAARPSLSACRTIRYLQWYQTTRRKSPPPFQWILKERRVYSTLEVVTWFDTSWPSPTRQFTTENSDTPARGCAIDNKKGWAAVAFVLDRQDAAMIKGYDDEVNTLLVIVCTELHGLFCFCADIYFVGRLILGSLDSLCH